MADGAGGEKTEKPTPKKLKESRKEGQVARTQELGGWGSLLLITLVLPMGIGKEIESARMLFERGLRMIEDPTVPAALGIARDGLMHAFIAIIVLGSGVLVLSVAATVAQGGFYVATKAAKPKFSKLDPIKGAKRIFGPQAAWEGVKMLVKCTMVGLLVYSAVMAQIPLIGGLMPIGIVLEVGSDHAMTLLRSVAAAGLVMAGADYGMARRRIGKQTRMSKHDIKQEHKQSEGDPLVKSAIRARQLASARNRMMADVPEADVVLVNPPHVAVALRYQSDRGAPVVVARGAGAVATRIRETAAEAGVPLVRDVPLARAIYSCSEVGQHIPPELFAAVAQVLAFVIGRRSRGAGGGTFATPRSASPLPETVKVGRRTKRLPALSSGAAPVGR